MFCVQWIAENLLAPLIVSIVVEILLLNFMEIVEHIKKAHFFLDSGLQFGYYSRAPVTGLF